MAGRTRRPTQNSDQGGGGGGGGGILQSYLGGMIGDAVAGQQGDVSPIPAGQVNPDDSSFDARNQTRFQANNWRARNTAQQLNTQQILGAQDSANLLGNQQALALYNANVINPLRDQQLLDYNNKLALQQNNNANLFRGQQQFSMQNALAAQLAGQGDRFPQIHANDQMVNYGLDNIQAKGLYNAMGASEPMFNQALTAQAVRPSIPALAQAATNNQLGQDIYSAQYNAGRIPQAQAFGNSAMNLGIAQNQAGATQFDQQNQFDTANPGFYGQNQNSMLNMRKMQTQRLGDISMQPGTSMMQFDPDNHLNRTIQMPLPATNIGGVSYGKSIPPSPIITEAPKPINIPLQHVNPNTPAVAQQPNNSPSITPTATAQPVDPTDINALVAEYVKNLQPKKAMTLQQLAMPQTTAQRQQVRTY